VLQPHACHLFEHRRLAHCVHSSFFVRKEVKMGVDMNTVEWWRGAVIYQIYPRSFADSNGDGIGDLPGITTRLDYVAALGVDAIWISPFFTSPMHDYGYDVADYRDVDPLFGTLADFDTLLAKAHALGLRVIVDLVFAHTSDEHSWFVASRDDREGAFTDWYVWADAKADGAPPNNWQSVFGGPSWTWNAKRGQYFMHNFLRQQPQLNVQKLEVQEALLDIAAYWLDRGVDGFRLDAINYAMHNPALTDNPALPLGVGKRTRPFDFQSHVHNQSQPEIPAFLARLRMLTDAYEAAFVVGEIGGEWEQIEIKTYTANDRHLHSGYSFAFLTKSQLTAELVRDVVGNWAGLPGEGWPSWAFSNHDAPRAGSRWQTLNGTLIPPALSLSLLMCLRGNVFLYQGEELGLPQAEVPFERLRDPEAIANWPLTHGRDGARTPMPWLANAPFAGFSCAEPWLPVDPRHAALAVDAQEQDSDAILHLTRRLIKLRRDTTALRSGSLTLIETEPSLLAFDRADGAVRMRCIFNLSDMTVDIGSLGTIAPVLTIGKVDLAKLAPLSAMIGIVE
jgi:alpha-glucosidase